MTGFTVLGGPVELPGQGSSTSAVWTHRLRDMACSLRALEQFPQMHIQYTLLRSCLDACKVSDLLRVSNYTLSHDKAEACTRLSMGTLQRLLGTALSDAQWLQASMPVRHGGLGISDATHSHLAARLACASDFVTRGPKILSLPAGVDLFPSDGYPVLTAAMGMLGSVAPLDGWSTGDRPFEATNPDWRKQSKWTDRLVKCSMDSLRMSVPARDNVRLHAQQSPHAGAWLAATPSAAMGTLLEGSEFRRAARWWLGMPQMPHEALGTQCPWCSALSTSLVTMLSAAAKT